MRQFVIFKLGQEKYAFDIEAIGGINELKSITPLPDAPAFIEGLMNLRGEIIPIIDLKKRFNLTLESTGDGRVIIVQTDKGDLGFLVDDASETLRVDEEDILPTPKVILSRTNRYLTGVIRREQEVILIIDLGIVLSGDEIEDILSMAT